MRLYLRVCACMFVSDSACLFARHCAYAYNVPMSLSVSSTYLVMSVCIMWLCVSLCVCLYMYLCHFPCLCLYLSVTRSESAYYVGMFISVVCVWSWVWAWSIVSMSVCMHVRMYLCMYVFIKLHILTAQPGPVILIIFKCYTGRDGSTLWGMYVCKSVCFSISVYVFLSLRMYACLSPCMCIVVYVCVCVYVRVFIQLHIAVQPGSIKLIFQCYS